MQRSKSLLIEAITDLTLKGLAILAAVIIAPFALWMILSGRKRQTDDDYYDEEEEEEDLRDASRTSGRRQPTSVAARAQRNPLEANWAAAQAQARHSADDARAGLSRASMAENDVSSAHPESLAPSVTGFAGWLQTQPRATRQSLAIEFLIYWMAYSDDRYPPELKQRIFKNPDPDSHEIVKRWVLKEDVHAFSDVIDWLQRNTGGVQQQQIVQLLMALLINGNVPSPVQNTMLRFLGDVFYLSNPTIDEQFEHDYGATIPSIPRVDRLAWWERQTADAVQSWDARGLSSSDELTRNAAQLGVHFDDGVKQIEAAYKRAIHRCRPERFDQLGKREHQLISSRRARLTEARDHLIEALA